MSMSANLHNIKIAEAKEYGGISWLRLEDGAFNHLSVYMPLSVAEAMAEAYHDAMEAHENAAEQQALEVQAAGMGGNDVADDYPAHIIAMRGL